MTTGSGPPASLQRQRRMRAAETIQPRRTSLVNGFDPAGVTSIPPFSEFIACYKRFTTISAKDSRPLRQLHCQHGFARSLVRSLAHRARRRSRRTVWNRRALAPRYAAGSRQFGPARDRCSRDCPAHRHVAGRAARAAGTARSADRRRVSGFVALFTALCPSLGLGRRDRQARLVHAGLEHQRPAASGRIAGGHAIARDCSDTLGDADRRPGPGDGRCPPGRGGPARNVAAGRAGRNHTAAACARF